MRRLGVIGVGKLGICFAINAERRGWEVTAVDTAPKTVEAINSRVLHSDEPSVTELLAKALHLRATADLLEAVSDEVGLLFVFVATPSLPDGGYDHAQIDDVADRLAGFGKRASTVQLVIGSTTMPGYCDSLSRRLGPLGYEVSYCPEFIAQGTIIRDQLNPDQVLIGQASEAAGEVLEQFYMDFCENSPRVCRMDRLSAEIAKIATNCFLTTKISFANSIGDLAVKAGADPDAILRAIGADSRIGQRYLSYGFGFGGPCFPRDNRALGRFADDVGYELLLSKATDEVNRRHLEFQFGQRMRTEGPVIFDHVTYKKGTTILEESQQLALALKLARAGKQVVVRDRPEVIAALHSLYPGLFCLEEHGTVNGAKRMA